MSALPAATPQGSKPLLRLLPQPGDRAFLPSALEIIETPPSPARTALMLTICAFVVAALAWSWFGRIDIIATARGKIEPAGHVKVVEPLQNGTVTEIRVTEGQHVKAGDVLLVLDGREDEAARAEAEQALLAAQAEALRREAEIAAVRGGTVGAPQMVKWPNKIPAAIRERESAVFTADLAELSATLVNLDAQEREKTAAVTQLDMSLAADYALVRPLADRVHLRQTLVNEGNGSRLTLLDAEQSALQNQVQIAGDSGRRIMAQAAIKSLQTEREHTVDSFLADDERKLDDARHTADDKQQEVAEAAARLDRMTLTAPIDGRVQALSVTNPGQVVTTGQEVMRLVPTAGPLEIEAYITNDDIGFVSPGQTAELKIDSFPFSRYGTVNAEVVSVAYDAIPADVADRALTDESRQDDPGSHALAPEGKPMSDLVFAARLKPSTSVMKVGDRTTSLAAGMTVSVEIKTGSRRIIGYLFSPLVEVASNAMGER
jgi:hemolysin D